MRKESWQQRSHSLTNSSSVPMQPTDTDLLSPEDALCLNRHNYIDWVHGLKNSKWLHTFRIKSPDLVSKFKKVNDQIRGKWNFPHLASKKKSIKNTHSQLFIDSIVLTSDRKYLDCIGLESRFVQQNVEKVFDFVVSLRLPKNMSHNKRENKDLHSKQLKISWISEFVTELEKQILSEMIRSRKEIKVQGSGSQTNFKNIIAKFWRSLDSESSKTAFLILGENNTKLLCEKIFEEEGLEISSVGQIQEQIDFLLKLSAEEFAEEICSWRITKKSSKLVWEYHEKIFNQIIARFLMEKKESINERTPNDLHYSDKSQKSTESLRKQQSVEFSEQFQLIPEITQFSVEEPQVVNNKTEQNLLQYIDNISREANLSFDRKVLGFERLRHILHDTFGLGIKLYGSLASGIAIEDSDVDVAIDASILNWYPELANPRDQIELVFGYLVQYFSQVQCITQIKPITSAAIPIIKLTIDTNIIFQLYQMNPDVYYNLNRPVENGGLVNIDLTIETYLPTIKHLGVVSTQQTIKWIQEHPQLQYALILIKSQLNRCGLNETYYGGINTYTLLVMMVAVIKNHGNRDRSGGVAHFLKDFLHFFSQEFDEKNFCIDLSCERIFVEKFEQSSTQSYLQVRDPLNDGRVMTRNCFRYEQIKNLFRAISQNLDKLEQMTGMQDFVKSNNESQQSESTSLSS